VDLSSAIGIDVAPKEDVVEGNGGSGPQDDRRRHVMREVLQSPKGLEPAGNGHEGERMQYHLELLRDVHELHRL